MRLHTVIRSLLCALVGIATLTGTAAARKPAPPQRLPAGLPQHQLWKINTRDLPAYDNFQANVGKWRYEQFSDGLWTVSSKESFDRGKKIPTCVVVHGSPASDDYVVGLSMDVYYSLSKFLGPEKTIRIVIWSWPADKTHASLIKDFRDQTIRGERQGYYLAHFVDQQRKSSPVMLIGYSMGARSASAALQLIGGGRVESLPAFQADTKNNQPIIGVLVAAAIDTTWLAPGGRYDRVVGQTDHFLVTVNSRDPILQRYPRLYGSKKAIQQSIGYCGIANRDALQDNASRYTQIDITEAAGATHDIRSITRSRPLLEKISKSTFELLLR
jgi:hypothetical protein